MGGIEKEREEKKKRESRSRKERERTEMRGGREREIEGERRREGGRRTWRKWEMGWRKGRGGEEGPSPFSGWDPCHSSI